MPPLRDSRRSFGSGGLFGRTRACGDSRHGHYKIPMLLDGFVATVAIVPLSLDRQIPTARIGRVACMINGGVSLKFRPTIAIYQQ